MFILLLLLFGALNTGVGQLAIESSVPSQRVHWWLGEWVFPGHSRFSDCPWVLWHWTEVYCSLAVKRPNDIIRE